MEYLENERLDNKTSTVFVKVLSVLVIITRMIINLCQQG